MNPPITLALFDWHWLKANWGKELGAVVIINWCQFIVISNHIWYLYLNSMRSWFRHWQSMHGTKLNSLWEVTQRFLFQLTSKQCHGQGWCPLGAYFECESGCSTCTAWFSSGTALIAVLRHHPTEILCNVSDMCTNMKNKITHVWDIVCLHRA